MISSSNFDTHYSDMFSSTKREIAQLIIVIYMTFKTLRDTER